MRLWACVEASGALPMLTGLCVGHVGVVWWVWFGRTVRIRTYVHTFVHPIVTGHSRYRCAVVPTLGTMSRAHTHGYGW